MAATRAERAIQNEIDSTARMLASTLDFIRRYPADPYVAKRQAQAAQMQKRLQQLTGGM